MWGQLSDNKRKKYFPFTSPQVQAAVKSDSDMLWYFQAFPDFELQHVFSIVQLHKWSNTVT